MFCTKLFKHLLLLLTFIIKAASSFSQYNCPDTSFRKLMREDTSASFWNHRIIKSNDGNIFMPAYLTHGTFNNNKRDGYLIKSSYNGDVIWAKRIVAELSMGLETVHETNDGGLLLIGEMAIPMPYNGRFEMVLLKLSNSGSVQWFKTYKSTYLSDTTTGTLTIKDIVEDSDGSFFITAYNWVTSGNLPSVIKFSSTGNMLWHRGFAIGSGPWAFGLSLRNNEIRLVGKALTTIPNTNITVAPITIISLNKMNGSLNGTKAFYPPYANSFPRSLTNNSEVMTKSNGNIVVYGITFDNYFTQGPPGIVHHSLTEFNPDFEPIKSYVFKSDEPGFRADWHMTVFEDGSGFFMRNKYINLTASDLLVGKFNNGVVSRERIIETRGNAQHSNSSNFITTGNGATLFTRTMFDNTQGWAGIELYKIHDSDTSSSCLGRDTMLTRIEEQTLLPIPISIDSVFNSFIVETSRSFTGIVEEQLNNTNNCENYSICDTLKIHGIDTICTNQQSLSYSVHKNPECGAWVNWRIDTSVVRNLILVNDTTVSFEFTQNWQGYLYAEIQTSCGLLKDSIFITALNSPGQVDLGPDSSICPNNTLLLNVHKGFISYLWQDGSTDSIFAVTSPGTYWVQAIDACLNIFRDTIIISPAAPVPFDLGPGLTKCNNDSLTIIAPGGFLNYTWSPNYNISNTNSQSVFVFPSVDTMYKVSVEKTPGCFAYDSIYIYVNNSAFIDLGADTSLCAGNSVILNAGNGFINYIWNTGQSSASIIVNSAGTFSIIATDANNCISKDTVRVINVFNNPVVNLPKDSLLCTGTSRNLNAGAGMSSYLWNTGATTNSISVNNVGAYWVNVIDNNGCTSTDTTRITKLLALPAAYLPADTFLCSYSTLKISPIQTYSSYAWSTGSSQSTITVSQSGIYWLRVTDNFNCTGRDTIVVNPKQCFEGFFIPNAFTPNKDGKNDIFRPLLSGVVSQFKFTIYNRWGQLVYQTSELGKGWDGRLSGKDIDTNVFVWTCEYQFEGQTKKFAKGTCVLIR
jgi:gliding motility-associated-like protein